MTLKRQIAAAAIASWQAFVTVPILVVFGILLAWDIGRGYAFSLIVDFDQSYMQLSILLTVGGLVIGGVIDFILGRVMLRDNGKEWNEVFWRWVGLYVIYMLVLWALMTAGSVAIVMNAEAFPMLVYSQQYLIAVGTIITFPIFVRLLAFAGGNEQPNVLGCWSALMGAAKGYFVIYLLAQIAFSTAAAFVATIVDPLRGTALAPLADIGLASSFITTLVAAAGYAIAVAAARAIIPSGSDIAEEFA